ncbi:hypothetical protein [Rubrobacter calidifluminis]|uniref:hypothetical protein n=1 Tax=Rubrobacter calidifluminis TaxID=1392640 RepID=UPI0023604A50|nr:hypothetical protein [Rubrobacter calidifluminis]
MTQPRDKKLDNRREPFRIGLAYGAVAIVVAIATNLYFLFIDPRTSSEWLLAVIQQYRTPFALTVYIFLGILAALRVRPSRLDPGSSYGSLLVRDGALAATVIAVLVWVSLFVILALEATVFAGAMRDYAQAAAPRIVHYVNEARKILSNPPPPARVGPVRSALQPPQLWDLGRSIFNGVLRAIIMGGVGAAVGALRGRSRRNRGQQERG